MTLEDLKEHLDRIQTLNYLNEELEALRSVAYSANAPSLTGMPHGTGISDRVGRFATEIVELESRVKYMESQIEESEARISEWLSSIEDFRVRIALRLHYLRGLQWKEVAPAIGKYCTESGVKNMCHRYLKNQRGDGLKEKSL